MPEDSVSAHGQLRDPSLMTGSVPSGMQWLYSVG